MTGSGVRVPPPASPYVVRPSNDLPSTDGAPEGDRRPNHTRRDARAAGDGICDISAIRREHPLRLAGRRRRLRAPDPVQDWPASEWGGVLPALELVRPPQVASPDEAVLRRRDRLLRSALP